MYLEFWRVEATQDKNGIWHVAELFIYKGRFGGGVIERPNICSPSLDECIEYCFEHGIDSVFIKRGVDEHGVKYEKIEKRG